MEDAIRSVLEQSYTNIELIVVDDGSEDGSKELLENIKNKKIVLLHNDQCKGVSNARNKGLSVAKGKYIAYLDSDNLWDSRYLAAMVGAFLELPDADVLLLWPVTLRTRINTHQLYALVVSIDYC